MDNGFIDLRQGGDAGRVSDSFWPSFTDIMMVVVMIFMIASVVLILRNWELVAELRATMESERRAAEAVKFTTEANATLEEQLAQAQHQISLIRMQLMQSAEANEEKTRIIAEKNQQLLSSQSESQRLAANILSMNRELDHVSSRLNKTESERSQLQAAFNDQLKRLDAAYQDISRLEKRNQQQASEITRYKQENALTQQELLSLKGDYETIKVKYEKLIKPARTAKGKHVVEVRYSRKGQEYRIDYKEPGDNTYRQMQRKSLEKRLAELKQRYPKNLYVKIVIPDNSGLSYSEAWNFTKDMLDKYDYYGWNK